MTTYDYDFIVIGGGSGGMAASKEAVACGAKKVALFDYVKPTYPHGTKWGLGGTCVNVGCIPKKLMHYAASIGMLLHHDARQMGWKVNANLEHDWFKMSETIRNHIKSLNFNYRNGLRSKGVTYINALAQMEDPHKIAYEKNGETIYLTAQHILIAVGGRPFVPDEETVPGAKQYSITSDDLFWLTKPPGKTLIVGASYIGLECAGFLTELGFPTTVAVRSCLLRGFDRQCAEKIGKMMRELGTRFEYGLPRSISKTPTGTFQVKFVNDTIPPEEFDSVIYATGRRADTQLLNLEAIGIKMTPEGKIYADQKQQTSVSSVYVVGDAHHGAPELTPVAIKTGELLARRLFGGAETLMDWGKIPTTVFTPVEYGSIGDSEETANWRYGAEDIETFLFEFSSLEVAAVHRKKHSDVRTNEYDIEASPNCLVKLVCQKSKSLLVVGFHCVGPHAGEITQGYALALRLGATKHDFDSTVGIHPTDAEAFHDLSITRASGKDWVASGGCGGGKCG